LYSRPASPREPDHLNLHERFSRRRPKGTPFPNLDSELPINQASDERDNFFPARGELLHLEDGGNGVLASAASLIWFINYYFPLGPLLRIFFQYRLRWFIYAGATGQLGWRQEFLGCFLVLMGTNSQHSVYHPIYWGAVVLRGNVGLVVSIGLGTLLSVLGFFFGFAAVNFGSRRLGLFITQVTELWSGYFCWDYWLSVACNSSDGDRAGLRQQCDSICSTSGSLVPTRPLRQPDSSLAGCKFS